MNDRRKMHPKEKKKIDFWKNNKLDLHHVVTMSIIISDFLLSKEYDFYKKGMPFARVMPAFMSVKYGSFDELKNNELEDLRSILKFRLKQFEE